MTNAQIAHDLTVARMAGMQLPAKELVEEYHSTINAILECLNAGEPKKDDSSL